MSMRTTSVVLAVAIALSAASAVHGQSVLTAAPDPYHEILSAAFQADTEARSHSRLTSGNRLELLEDGIVSFPRKFALVSTATAQIFVMTFQWDYDRTGLDFADALIARARAGVEVRAVVDGTIADPRIVVRLRRGGVRVARYNPWLLGIGGRSGHMHEKAICVDFARAILGGMNIADDYALGNGTNRYYHDADLYVEGWAAGEVARRFLELYSSLEPGDAGAAALLSQIGAYTQQPAAAAPGRDGFARVIVGEPDLGRHYITDYYVRAIDAARRQVVWHVNNPQPVDPIARALRDAATRGVRVVIVTNSMRAYQLRFGLLAGFFEYVYNLTAYRRAIAARGIEIFELDAPLHSKALTIDGVVASIGSYNLGLTSIARNTEQVVLTYDPATVRAVEEMFDRDLARAKRVQ